MEWCSCKVSCRRLVLYKLHINFHLTPTIYYFIIIILLQTIINIVSGIKLFYQPALLRIHHHESGFRPFWTTLHVNLEKNIDFEMISHNYEIKIFFQHIQLVQLYFNLFVLYALVMSMRNSSTTYFMSMHIHTYIHTNVYTYICFIQYGVKKKRNIYWEFCCEVTLFDFI